MIRALCVVIFVTTVLARPEAPISSYLPPSNTYDTPGSGFSVGISSAVADSYGAPNIVDSGGQSDGYNVNTYETSSRGNDGRNKAPESSYSTSKSNNFVTKTNGGRISGSSGAFTNGNGRARLSNGYGPPGTTTPILNGQSRYDGNRPTSSYGAPGETGFIGRQNSESRPSSVYGYPGQSGKVGNRPSNNYSSPSKGPNGGRPSSTFSSSGNGNKKGNGNDNVRTSGTYGVLKAGNRSNNGGRPSNNYGAPAQSNLGTSDSYAPPASGNPIGGLSGATPNQEYLPPNREALEGADNIGGSRRDTQDGYDYSQGDTNGSDSGDNGINEPASYEFSYQVEDSPSGLSFGHYEMRETDFTTGQYNVLLPDGRKQVVEYEADQAGYRPQIRYENANTDAAGVEKGDVGYDYSQNNDPGTKGDEGYARGQSLNSDGYFGGQTSKTTNGRERNNGNGRVRSDTDIGQYLTDNGYSNGRPNGRQTNSGRNNQNNFGEKGYSVSDANAYTGQDNINGQGYSNGRPSNDNGYRKISNSFGKRPGNLARVLQTGFGPGGQNGDNNGNGYQY